MRQTCALPCTLRVISPAPRLETPWDCAMALYLSKLRVTGVQLSASAQPHVPLMSDRCYMRSQMRVQ